MEAYHHQLDTGNEMTKKEMTEFVESMLLERILDTIEKHADILKQHDRIKHLSTSTNLSALDALQ